MSVNYIALADIQEAKQENRMVQIKCKSCPDKGNSIGNHLGVVKDHIESGTPLHNCPSCDAETKVNLKYVATIKNILGIGENT